MNYYIFDREKNKLLIDNDGELVNFPSNDAVWDYLKNGIQFSKEWINKNYFIMKGCKILEPESIPTESIEDIRQTHYDAWKSNKKFIDIEVKELEDKSGWIGTCKTELGIVIYRDTKQQTIYAMVGALSAKGYEVGNLPEIYGIKNKS